MNCGFLINDGHKNYDKALSLRFFVGIQYVTCFAF